MGALPIRVQLLASLATLRTRAMLAASAILIKQDGAAGRYIACCVLQLDLPMAGQFRPT